jgi:hypothetical protein
LLNGKHLRALQLRSFSTTTPNNTPPTAKKETTKPQVSNETQVHTQHQQQTQVNTGTSAQPATNGPLPSAPSKPSQHYGRIPLEERENPLKFLGAVLQLEELKPIWKDLKQKTELLGYTLSLPEGLFLHVTIPLRCLLAHSLI